MRNEIGQIAMELIADYPLYASTSNISYDEAIAVAKIFFGNDLERAKRENELVAEYFATQPNPTADDCQRWVTEKLKGDK